MEDVSTRVSRGAEFLDRCDRLWFLRINVETLNMCMSSTCILGQLYDSYLEGRDKILLLSDKECVACGFASPLPSEYRVLKEVWLKMIEVRREAQGF
jgi:hypothetical protein